MIAAASSIPASQMIVVTGTPRSGTSLMMQTLHLLGVPVAGSRFPREERSTWREGEDLFERQRRIDRARCLNPRGFYEVPGVVMRGTRELRDFGGRAIKIVSAAAYPRCVRGRELGTSLELVHRYVFCLRDPRQVAQSQCDLRRRGSVQGPDPRRFVRDNGGLLRWLARQSDELRARWLVVDYDDFLISPAATIERVVAHLDWSGRRRVAAIANVEPRLQHAKRPFDGWPASLRAAGRAADRLYDTLRSFDAVAPISRPGCPV